MKKGKPFKRLLHSPATPIKERCLLPGKVWGPPDWLTGLPVNLYFSQVPERLAENDEPAFRVLTRLPLWVRIPEGLQRKGDEFPESNWKEATTHDPTL